MCAHCTVLRDESCSGGSQWSDAVDNVTSDGPAAAAAGEHQGIQVGWARTWNWWRRSGRTTVTTIHEHAACRVRHDGDNQTVCRRTHLLLVPDLLHWWPASVHEQRLLDFQHVLHPATSAYIVNSNRPLRSWYRIFVCCLFSSFSSPHIVPPYWRIQDSFNMDSWCRWYCADDSPTCVLHSGKNFVYTMSKYTVFQKTIPFLSRVSILLLTRDIDIPILSVRLSVTRWYCMKTAQIIVLVFSPYGSPIIPVLRASNTFTKFRRGHPLRGR